MVDQDAASGQEEETQTDDAGESEDALSDLISKAQEQHVEAASSETDGPEGDQDAEEGVEDATTEAKTEETAESGEDAVSEEGAEKQAAEPIEAPQHWPAEQRTAFGGLPREAQDLLIARDKEFEGNFTRKSQDLAETTRFAGEIRQVMEPYKQQMALSGLSEAGAVNQLFALHKMYTEDPVGYFRMVAQDVAGKTGTDLATLVEQASTDVDPVAAQWEQRFRQLEDTIQNGQKAAQKGALDQIDAQITAFRTETDDKGALRRPHFDAVEEAMPLAISNVQRSEPGLTPTQTLEKAYEQALWLNPDIRQQLVSAEKQAEIDKLKAAEKEAVDKAKTSRTAVKSSGAPSVAASGDLDSIIRQNMEKAGFPAG